MFERRLAQRLILFMPNKWKADYFSHAHDVITTCTGSRKYNVQLHEEGSEDLAGQPSLVRVLQSILNSSSHQVYCLLLDIVDDASKFVSIQRRSTHQTSINLWHAHQSIHRIWCDTAPVLNAGRLGHFTTIKRGQDGSQKGMGIVGILRSALIWIARQL